MECHIQIETDISGYTIGEIFSQLTSEDLSRWHPVAFFSPKMILAETRYETYNGEFLAIVKTFKIKRHYLENCKHEVLILTDHNNLQCFIDMKSLSYRQVCWNHELSRCLVRIPSVFCWGRKNSLSQEYKDTTPITIFVGTGFEIRHYEVEKGLFPPTPSPHIWDNHPIAAVSVLEHHLKQTSSQRSLYYKYQRNEKKTSWVIE